MLAASPYRSQLAIIGVVSKQVRVARCPPSFVVSRHLDGLGVSVTEGRRSPGWLDRNAAGIFAALGGATLLAYAVLWLRPLWLGDFEPFSGAALYIGTIFGY